MPFVNIRFLLICIDSVLGMSLSQVKILFCIILEDTIASAFTFQDLDRPLICNVFMKTFSSTIYITDISTICNRSQGIVNHKSAGNMARLCRNRGAC